MPSLFGDLQPRSAHLHVRISPDALERLRSAAHLRHQDMTSFVLGAALDRAAEILDRERRLSPRHRSHRQPDDGPDDEPFDEPFEDGATIGADQGDEDDDEFGVPDADDPDIDLWGDYRVTSQPPTLRRLLFDTLKERRRVQREQGLEPEPVLRPPPGYGPYERPAWAD